jgi:hypothetical protein
MTMVGLVGAPTLGEAVGVAGAPVGLLEAEGKAGAAVVLVPAPKLRSMGAALP